MYLLKTDLDHQTAKTPLLPTCAAEHPSKPHPPLPPYPDKNHLDADRKHLRDSEKNMLGLDRLHLQRLGAALNMDPATFSGCAASREALQHTPVNFDDWSKTNLSTWQRLLWKSPFLGVLSRTRLDYRSILSSIRYILRRIYIGSYNTCYRIKIYYLIKTHRFDQYMEGVK